MKIYNTLTGKKQEFIPLEEGKVKMYACGITVSGEAHIGHAYQALIYEIIRKYFEKYTRTKKRRTNEQHQSKTYYPCRI